MFNDLQAAFEDKSDSDLNRAYLLFKTISNPLISKMITALAKTAIWLRLPIDSIIRATVYKHFCGGTTIEDSKKTIEKLWDSGIKTILDFSVEGQDSDIDFNRTEEETIKSLNKGKGAHNIPFAVFKPTGLARFDLLEKISSNKELSKEEEIEKINFERRIENICEISSKNKVPVFIDAEESWIQDAIDNIAIKMMQKFNKKQPWIFNTLQLYRNDRIEHLEKLIANARKKNFFIGLKIVRGAYHIQEIERAKDMQYRCPVHKIKANTDLDYNKALKICVENIDIISFCAGTHNEESSRLLINLLEEHDIAKEDQRIYLSQLLGMSDHISFNLAKKGYNVSKYVPFGPIKEMIPYLIRRAEENSSVKGQTSRELNLIARELKRRKNS